ncbi:hypothetical protein DRH27_00070 [Candidatus Falkowbacteria bacterium]|nr:MAG: hypothetical protein DRH27_00070 [Candidatus Falkowbacteria bacterium]
MAVIKKMEKNTETVPKKKAVKKSISMRTKKKMSKVKHVPSQSLGDYPILIHGPYGSGKTTLANMMGKVYNLMFEPNDSYAYVMDNVKCWEDFKDLKEEFLQGNHDFTTLSIDNVQVAYDLAMEYAGKKYGFEHPGGMNDYGASWNKVKKVFIPLVRELMMSDYGFLALCHTDEKELTTISGKKYNALAPDLPKQAYQFLCAQVPNIFYYHFVNGERWLQIIGDEHIIAKNRMKGHFMTPSGEPVHKIPMGGSEEEACENLINAFNNLQELPYNTTFVQKGASKFKKSLKKKVLKKS